MRTFDFRPVADIAAGIAVFRDLSTAGRGAVPSWFAGGTTLIDLMKLDVLQPATLIDIANVSDTRARTIEIKTDGVSLGALCTMSEVARHPTIQSDYPVLSQSLQLAASAQLRNMATLGGNVMQRTRCAYYRDVSYPACNKRVVGSGCSALDGVTRGHAVLGVDPEPACIATYAGDFAQALLVLDATLETTGLLNGRPFAELHRAPGDTPHIETALAADEIITAFVLPPPSAHSRRSRYVKIRDRQSYAFALCSAAVAIAFDGPRIAACGIALGGVATRPWRAHEAEAVLIGRTLDEESATVAASAAFAAAIPQSDNAFKIELGRRTLVRALLEARDLEVAA